jgi:CRP-like cAMP-binding protein
MPIAANRSLFDPPCSHRHGLSDPVMLAWVSHCLDDTYLATHESEDDDVLQPGRLELTPGDALYAQGTTASYIYIVERGLMQCLGRPADGQRDPLGPVSFVGTGGLIGRHDQHGRRPEAAVAVTRTHLLGLPQSDLQQLQATAPALAALITRRLSQSLMGGLRVAYRLRDLPVAARILAGLSHMAQASAAVPDALTAVQTTLPMMLASATFAHWLGLPLSKLSPYLAQLENAQVLKLADGQITSLKPQVILNATQHLSPIRQ